MEYSIYTYGTGDVIAKVLEVLALLCKSENIIFRPVLVLSASLGAVWMGLRAIWGGNVSAYIKDWLIPTVLVFNLMFVPKTSVMIIDQVDTFHRARSVSNVPVGVALIGHVASHISHTLTEAIESRLVPAEFSGTTYSKTGPMFAAHLMAASRKLVASDPTLRENLKNYVDQCYVWPYLYTNIDPGRREALKSPDILSFMATYPHKGLGMYWKDEGGTRFLKCGEVSARLIPAMRTETEKGLVTLSAQLLPSLSDKRPEFLSNALKRVGVSAWDAIARDSATVHKRVEQQMVINAGREAIDDGLERLGGNRRFPQLISYSATRADEQQNYGFLVAGASASKHLPILQGIILGLLYISFVVVVGFTFLDQGLKLWITWIKLIFWVESWPIFYGMLNCIGMLWLKNASETISYSFQPGITWLTQSGLADASWDAYCAIQNLFLAVPMISWALIAKSGSMLVSMTERALPGLGKSLGASMVDNTPTFDAQTFHTRTMNTFQMSQQTLGSNYSLGSSIDDGQFRLTNTPQGEQVIQEHLSSGRHAINANEAIQGHISNQLATEKSNLKSLQHDFGESKRATLQEAYERTKSFAAGKKLDHIASEDTRKAVQQEAREAIQQINRLAHQENLSEEESVGITLGTGPIGAALGVDINAGFRATHQDLNQSTTEAGNSKEFGASLAYGLTESAGRTANSSEDYSQRSSDSLGGHIAKNLEYAQRESVQLSTVDRWSQMSSISETKGVNITESLNDDVYKYIAAQRNISFGEAARWASSHSTEFKEKTYEYLAGYTSHMNNWVNSANGPIDASTIDAGYRTYKQEIAYKARSVDDTFIKEVKDLSVKEGINVERGEALAQQVDAFSQTTNEHIQSPDVDHKAAENRLKNQKRTIESTHADLEKLHKDKAKDWEW